MQGSMQHAARTCPSALTTIFDIATSLGFTPLSSMLYCKRLVDSVSDASYYLLVSIHSSDGDPEHSTSFDMQVTDGQSAWSQSGLRRPNTQIADWMATAKQALTENSGKFTFIITPKKRPDILRLRWEYYKEMKDFEGRLAGQIDVEHASSPSEVVQNILGTALDNLSSLQASQKQIQQQCNLFKQEAETAQRQVQDYVQQKQKREAELYVKFAAVLNEKKAKAVEWKLKAEQAQASVQKASTEGVADEGTPPRDLGDTYSQSTDPSDEEQEGGVDDFEAAGPSKHAVSSQQAPKERTSGAAEQGHHSERIPGPSAQPAHQRGSLQQEPSGTLDTQHDPAEDANMQEGDLMDVDTVPIPAEDLGQDITASKNKQDASFIPDVTATSKPARPKAATRRRR